MAMLKRNPAVLERTDVGTFKPKYGERMEQLCIRVPKPVADKIKKLPDKNQFLRNLLIKAAEELDDE